MTTIDWVLHGLHGLNRWLALGMGAWAVGLLVSGVRGRVGFGPLERRSLAAFTGALHLQAVLGLLIWAVMAGVGQAPFEGRAGTQWGHMGGGLVAAALAALAIVLSRRAASDLARFRWAAGLSGLALLLLGRFTLSLPLTALAVLAGWWIHRRRVAPTAAGDRRAVER